MNSLKDGSAPTLSSLTSNVSSDVTRLWQKQAMPAPESVCLLKLYPNRAEIGYFGAKTWKFIHLLALAQIPAYFTGNVLTHPFVIIEKV